MVEEEGVEKKREDNEERKCGREERENRDEPEKQSVEK